MSKTNSKAHIEMGFQADEGDYRSKNRNGLKGGNSNCQHG